MNKKECRECQNKIELGGKLCPWRHISNDYCDKVDCSEKKHIASVSFGKDSLAMLLMLIKKDFPLDAVVFYDTGKEFQAIYNLRDAIQSTLRAKGIRYIELKPQESFDYKMFDHIRTRGKNKGKKGYLWCGGNCRWGTTDKLAAIDRCCHENNAFDYVGIAADEPERLKKERKPHKIFPLADWRLSEAECLEYCYSNGLGWLEKTNSIYDVPEYVDLYKILDRVSCWCCRNKNLKELKNIYKYFTNSYWKQLKQMQSKLDMPMKNKSKFNGTGSVFDLEKRFKKEIEEELGL